MSCGLPDCDECAADQKADDDYPLLAKAGPVYARPQLRAMVAAKIAANYLSSDPVSYDLAPIVLPADGGQAMGAYLLILSVRSPLLSPPRIAVSDVIRDAYPTAGQIEDAVRNALGILADARAELLKPQPGGGYHPGPN
jgi:hypothetical protein